MKEHKRGRMVVQIVDGYISVPAGYRIKVHTLPDGSQEITIEPI
jgi:hypothetical protein